MKNAKIIQQKRMLLLLLAFCFLSFASCKDERGHKKSVIETIIPTGTLGS